MEALNVQTKIIVMKTTKLIFINALILLFLGCTNDDTDLDFLQNTAAPTELDVSFNITQDNTGLVTITPNAVGATQFIVDYGDGSGETIDLAIGESTERIYPEGEYTIGLTAIAVNGKTTEATKQLVVSFRAPENLEISTEIDASNPFVINVSAIADFAASFLVYFDTSNVDEEPTLLELDGTVSFEYPSVGDYTIRVVALSGGVETTEATVDISIEAPTELPIDFEVFDESVFIGFGGASNAVIPNPDTNGNTSAKVGEIVKGAPEIWAGNVIILSSPLDLSTDNIITLDVWSPRPNGQLLVKLEDLNDGNIFIEKAVTLEGSSSWEQVSVDFSEEDLSNQYQKIVFFFDFGTVGDGSSDWTFYVDNIDQRPSIQTQPRIPEGFESPTFDYGIFSFGGPNFEPIPAAIVDNPDPSGINTTNKVFELTKPAGAQVWGGAGIALEGATDFSEGTTILLDVWSPTAGTPILYKMEDSNDPTVIFVEVVQNTTVAGQWETLAFDLTTFAGFDVNNNYDSSIFFANFGNIGTGATYYFDNIRIQGATVPRPDLPLQFESTLFDFSPFSFGGPNFEPIPASVATNPDSSGINTSGKVLTVEKPAGSQVWAGAGVPLSGPVDFSNGTTITVDVWSPTAGTPVLFKMEDSNDPTVIFVEVLQNTTVAGQWETLTFDLTSFAGFDANNNYDSAIVFPNFGNVGTGTTYHFDNITLIN